MSIQKSRIIWYISGVLPLVIAFASWQFFFPPHPTFTQTELVATTTLTAASSSNVEVNIGSEFNTYQNEEFGFSFQYPKDWNIRIPAFVSPVSLFNMTMEPISTPGGQITFNITQKYWIEGAMDKMKARGVVFEDTLVDGKKAYRTADKDRISRPATITLVLVDDEFWIDITGVKGNEEVYNMILDSFVMEPRN